MCLSKKRNQKNQQKERIPVDIVSSFMVKLAVTDTERIFTEQMSKIMKLSKKHSKENIVIDFCNYYGETILKFLSMKKNEEEGKNDPKMLAMLDMGIRELDLLCQSFIVKLLNNEDFDIKTDLKVLSTIKIYGELI